jgi:hypothetical protein
MKKFKHVCLDLPTPSSRDPRWDGENPPLYVLVDQADGECLSQKMDEIIG